MATVGPTATPPPAPLELTWSPAAPFDGTVAAVIGDRDEFVAVSADPERRLAWSSSNGESWISSDVPDPAPSDCEEFYEPRCFPNGAGMGQLVRLGDTLYSIGTTPGFNDYLRPVGWRLTDGQAWQAIESKAGFFGYGHVMDLAASRNALVAAKTNYPQYASDVWRWAPDTSWVATNLAGTNDAPLDVFDMAWSGEAFLAVGEISNYRENGGEPDTLPGVWSSASGRQWQQMPPPEDAVSLCSVTATRFGFVVLGLTDLGIAAWTAPAVGSWTRTDLAAQADVQPDARAYPEICAVVELDDGLLAVHGAQRGTLTWTSRDGLTWARGATLDIATGPDEVAALGDTVVIFGRPITDEGLGPVPSSLFVGTVAQ